MIAEMADSSGGAVDREELKKALGFDVPVHVQYGRWLGLWPKKDGSFKGILHRHLGTSLWKNSPVLEEIKPRLPVSLELGIIGAVIALERDVPSLVDPPSGCRFHPRYAQADCSCTEGIPELREVVNGHWVACHRV